MNIEGLGPRKVEALLELGLVKDASDLFTLAGRDGTNGIEKVKKKSKKKNDDSITSDTSATSDAVSLRDIPGWGPKSVSNLLASIERSRQVSMSRLLYALGIPAVGQQMAEDIAGAFTSFPDLWEYISGEKGKNEGYVRLSEIHGLGGKTLDNLIHFGHDASSRALVAKLIPQLIIKNENKQGEVASTSRASSFFRGKKICVTGPFARFTRAEITEIIIKNGL